MSMNQEVTAFIDGLPLAWQVELARQLRQIVLQAIPAADEKIQYGKPHYKKNNKYAAVITPAKGWVSLTIFNAQGLNTPDKLFETSENGDRKTIKIKQGQPVDVELLTRLLKEATATL